MAIEFEAQLESVNASIKNIGDSIKAQAEKADAEIKRHGEMNAETRAKVDEMLVTQGELLASQRELEQKLASAGKREEQDVRMSAGRRVANMLAEEGVTSSFRGSRRVSLPRSEITSADDSAGDTVAPDRRNTIMPLPERRMTIRDLLAPGTTDSNSIEYVKETGFTNAAAIVAETATKPYSDLTFELETAAVRTIAHMFKASRQILDDSAALRSFINARASYGLQYAEEQQLLNGDGSGSNISGLITNSTSFDTTLITDVTDEQAIDRIRMAILQAQLAEFPATGIVMHPTDWAAIELIKNSNGNYIIGNPQSGTVPTLWRLPVVTTQAIGQDTFLAGAFSLAAQIFDRMAVEILVSTENGTDFEENMVSIRAEERLALAVYRPEALIYGSVSGASV